MQGRSIGSKRRNVGEAAPQPTRASIYQEENTPLDWMAQDLRAQLANAQKPAAQQARALRHGLIASQLGLPMLEHAHKKGLEDWEQPELAASSGESAALGLDWPNTEQTTRYDEWELQKELVTYEASDPSYDEHPRLDLDLPPIATSYEPDFSPAYTSASGSYAYARRGQEAAQPSAARWQSPTPIRHRPSPQSPATQTDFPTHARSTTQRAAVNARARIATQTGSMTHGVGPTQRSEADARTRVATQTGSMTHGVGATQRGAADARTRVATQTGSMTHGVGPTQRGAADARTRVATQTGSMTHGVGATQRGAADARTRVATQTGFTTDAQRRGAPSRATSRIATSPGFAPYAQGAAGGAEPRSVTQASFAPRAFARQANDGPGHVHGVQAGAGGGAPHVGHASAARLPMASQPGAASGEWSKAPRSTVLRDDDDEPVGYPHRRGWLRRAIVLLVLAGGGYVAYPYVLQRAAAPAPATPTPIAAAPVVPESPPTPSTPVEPEQASEPEAPAAAPLSEKERRKAERRALIAERLRERRAARLGRSERSASDEPDRSSYASVTRSRDRAAHEADKSSYASVTRSRDRAADEADKSSYASATRGRAGDESERSRSYAGAPRSRDRAGDDWSTRPSAESSTSAHDDYVSGRHAAPQSGVLRINSLPWSEVHVDGQLIGHTPQMNLLLPAGKHRVTLVNREMQLSKSITIQITPGATTTQMVNLAQ